MATGGGSDAAAHRRLGFPPPLPLLLFARARPRCMPSSASACRAASSSATAAGDGGVQKPWLFVGLGNPGKVYQGTRYNALNDPPGKIEPASFVLRPFNKKEQEELDSTFHRGLESVRIMVLEGFNKSTTYVNTVQSSEMLNR